MRRIRRIGSDHTLNTNHMGITNLYKLEMNEEENEFISQNWHD